MMPEASSEDEVRRRAVTAWVQLTLGTLDEDERSRLDHEHPEWQRQATLWISEGMLGYLLTEMVRPDLSMIRDPETHQEHHDPQDVAARVAAHVLDVVDYRDELDVDSMS